MVRLRVIAIVVLLMAPAAAFAGEGMWTLNNLPTQTLQKKFGFTPSAQWVAHVQHAALRLAGGCSGSFVSADGLVMTNHHCANGCLSKLSGKSQNYMEQGFVAKDEKDEPKCPDIELNQLQTITNVTDRVQAATSGTSGSAFVKAQRAEIGRIEKACAGNDARRWRCQVVSLYHGGRFELYKYRRYQDVRLVFAPEQSIAFFGGDPDNFNFPRYDLDVTFLRAYDNGKPVHTEYLHFDPDGPKAGELVFVAGNPGSTSRTDTVAQLKAERDDSLTPLFGYLSELRGVLWQYSRQGSEQAKQAQEALFGIDNALKVFKGRLETLDNPALYARKEKQQKALKQWIDASAQRRKAYDDPWTSIAKAEKAYANIADRYRMVVRGEGFESDLFDYARTLVQAAEQRQKPNDQRLPQYRDSNLPALEQRLFSKHPVYPQYEVTRLSWSLGKFRQALGADAPLVHTVLGDASPSQLAGQLVDGSNLASVAARRALWKGGIKAIRASSDPMIQLALKLEPATQSIRQDYENNVEGVIGKASADIAKARFARYGTSIYPDATFTLRLSYGQVKGWDEKGTRVPPFTHFAGLYRRATGKPPFQLPESWIKSKPALDMDTRLDFVSSTDIIGGNSGSPVIDRKGDVVGLIFDGNIHSIGGDYWYDASLNRAVAVDTTALIASLRKVYHLDALADELVQGHR